MTRRVAGALALATVLTTGACGTTYVDDSAGTTAAGASTTLAPVRPGTPLDELFDEITALTADLHEQISADQGQADTWARIEDVWAEAERQIRERDPDDLFNFQQAIDLARVAVERRRPADGDKANRTWVRVADDYLERLGSD